MAQPGRSARLVSGRVSVLYIAIKLESLAARSTKVKGEGKKRGTEYCVLRGRENGTLGFKEIPGGEPQSPLGNRMAFPQSVEVFLVLFLLNICLIGLFKVQNSLEDGNTRVLFGFDCSLRFNYEKYVSIIV